MTPESATLNTEPEEQLYGKQTKLGASNFPSESRRPMKIFRSIGSTIALP